jgi:NADH-quinone oxidoreductase subunit J
VTADVFLFWFLALVTLGSGLSVILMTNPIYCALSLVMTMVGVAGLFVTLGAYFIAGVQLIVYAGAVMVLFVMVLMLFDLKSELAAFSRGFFTGALKILSVGVLGGLVVGAITMSTGALSDNPVDKTVKSQVLNPAQVAGSQSFAVASGTQDNVKKLAESLFLKHVFGFEALGILLLVIAVGTVALSRSRGGTHAQR